MIFHIANMVKIKRIITWCNYYLITVSYTHLDVYKRQDCTSQTGSDPQSFFFLLFHYFFTTLYPIPRIDVYKRQIEDLAISRTSSITDAILELTDYDSQWNTITVDFGDVGKRCV